MNSSLKNQANSLCRYVIKKEALEVLHSCDVLAVFWILLYFNCDPQILVIEFSNVLQSSVCDKTLSELQIKSQDIITFQKNQFTQDKWIFNCHYYIVISKPFTQGHVNSTPPMVPVNDEIAWNIYKKIFCDHSKISHNERTKLSWCFSKWLVKNNRMMPFI